MTRKSLFIASLFFICALAHVQGLAQTTAKSNGLSCVLEFEGTAIHFTSCSDFGITHKFKTEDISSNTGSEPIKKLRLEALEAKITLKRPISSDATLWAWTELVSLGESLAARKTCIISMMAKSGKGPIGRWRLQNACPASLTIDEEGNEVITLVVEFMQRIP